MIIMTSAISEVIQHIPSVHRVTTSDNSPLLFVLLLHHFQVPGLPTPWYKYFRHLLKIRSNNWTHLDQIKVCLLKLKPCYDEHRTDLHKRQKLVKATKLCKYYLWSKTADMTILGTSAKRTIILGRKLPWLSSSQRPLCRIFWIDFWFSLITIILHSKPSSPATR